MWSIPSCSPPQMTKIPAFPFHLHAFRTHSICKVILFYKQGCLEWFIKTPTGLRIFLKHWTIERLSSYQIVFSTYHDKGFKIEKDRVWHVHMQSSYSYHLHFLQKMKHGKVISPPCEIFIYSYYDSLCIKWCTAFSQQLAELQQENDNKCHWWSVKFSLCG